MAAEDGCALERESAVDSAGSKPRSHKTGRADDIRATALGAVVRTFCNYGGVIRREARREGLRRAPQSVYGAQPSHGASPAAHLLQTAW